MSLDLATRKAEREKLLRELKMAMFDAERIFGGHLENPVAQVCLRYVANPNTKSARMLPDGFFFSTVLPIISEPIHSLFGCFKKPYFTS